MSTLNTAKLYARIAFLRRQVLLRQLIWRTVAGALAVAAIVVAAGLATYALFVAIRPALGEFGATLTIAAIYLAASITMLLLALREPASPELEALAEMEVAALDAMMADSQGAIRMLSSAGHQIESLGSGVALGVGVLSALRKLLASRSS